MNLPPKVSKGDAVKACYHNAIVDALGELSLGVSQAKTSSSSSSSSAGASFGPMRGYRVIPEKSAFQVGLKYDEKEDQVTVRVAAGNIHWGDEVYEVEEYEETSDSGECSTIDVWLDVTSSCSGYEGSIRITHGTEDTSSNCLCNEDKLSIQIAHLETEVKSAGSRSYLSIDKDATVRYLNGDVWLGDSLCAEDENSTEDIAFRVWFTVDDEDGGESNKCLDKTCGKSTGITMHVGGGHVQGVGTTRKMHMRSEVEGEWDDYNKACLSNSTKYDGWTYVQSFPTGNNPSTISVPGTTKAVSAGQKYYVQLEITRDSEGTVLSAKLEITDDKSADASEFWNPTRTMTVLIGEYSDIKAADGKVTYTSVRGIYGDYWYMPLPVESRGVCKCSCGSSCGGGGTSLRPLEYLGSPYAWTRTGENEWTLVNVAVLLAENSAVAGTHLAKGFIFEYAGNFEGACAYISLSGQMCSGYPITEISTCREKALTNFAKMKEFGGVVVSVGDATTPLLVYLMIETTINNGNVEVDRKWGSIKIKDSASLPWQPQEYLQKVHLDISSTSDPVTFVGPGTGGMICGGVCNDASSFYIWKVTIPMALVTTSAVGRNVLVPIHQGFVEARPTMLFASGSVHKFTEFGPFYPSVNVEGTPSAANPDSVPTPYIPKGVVTSDDNGSADEADASANGSSGGSSNGSACACASANNS